MHTVTHSESGTSTRDHREAVRYCSVVPTTGTASETTPDGCAVEQKNVFKLARTWHSAAGPVGSCTRSCTLLAACSTRPRPGAAASPPVLLAAACGMACGMACGGDLDLAPWLGTHGHDLPLEVLQASQLGARPVDGPLDAVDGNVAAWRGCRRGGDETRRW